MVVKTQLKWELGNPTIYSVLNFCCVINSICSGVVTSHLSSTKKCPFEPVFCDKVKSIESEENGIK